MTSRSHLPSLSGNKLDYHPLPAGSPLLSLCDKCFPFFLTRRSESGSDMTGPRSGTRPTGGSWSTTTCKSWRKARPMENQRDESIPQLYPTLAERKIVTSTLDSSTPLLALNMRPVASMLITSFNKSATPLFQKKKKRYFSVFWNIGGGGVSSQSIQRECELSPSSWLDERPDLHNSREVIPPILSHRAGNQVCHCCGTTSYKSSF